MSLVCRRFERGDIYTFTANAILLAVNPFKRLPLYGKELLTEYFNMGYMRQQGIEPPQALGPHVFAIADSAYRDMMKVRHCAVLCCAGGDIILVVVPGGGGLSSVSPAVVVTVVELGSAIYCCCAEF